MALLSNKNMTRLLFLLFILLSSPFGLFAQKGKEANHAVATITTYDAQGKMLHATQCFFCSPTGDVWAPYFALEGAVKAEVIDAQGRTAEVQRVVSASSLYDVVRLTTNIPTRKLTFLPIAHQITTDNWLQTYYTVVRKEQPLPVSIPHQEKLDTLAYYTISTPNDARYFGAPLVNAAGEVVAITQKNVQKGATQACAIDARVLQRQLSMGAGIKGFSRDLRALHFPPLLPQDNEEQAYSLVFLGLLAPTDTAIAATSIRDFLSIYPNSNDLYAPAANFHANKRGDWGTAHAYIQQGLAKVGEHHAKLYSLLSDLMKAKAESDSLSPPRWTLSDALAAAEQSYALRPDTIAVRQQAILLAQLGRWKEARAKWQVVNASSLAQWDTYLLEATCVEHLQGDSTEVLRLITEAVNHYERTKVGSPQVYLTRANQLLKMHLYRQAVSDLQTFERQLPLGQLAKAAFYAERSNIEVKAKMYQQALDDLETAISRAETADERVLYLTKKGYLQLQVALWAEAATSAQSLLSLSPNNADGHKILGLSLWQRKRKREALVHLRRAQELGDEQAAQLIAKYSK